MNSWVTLFFHSSNVGEMRATKQRPLPSAATIRLKLSSAQPISHRGICVFTDSHVFTSHIHLSANDVVWHRFKHTTTSRSTHNSPSSKTEDIPHSPSRGKDTHLPRSQIPDEFLGNWTPGFGDPTPLSVNISRVRMAKNTTNDKESEGTLSSWQLLRLYCDQCGGFQWCTSSRWAGRVTSAVCYCVHCCTLLEEAQSSCFKFLKMTQASDGDE